MLAINPSYLKKLCECQNFYETDLAVSAMKCKLNCQYKLPHL